MSECVREMTSKELIEQSSLSNKELILQRLKSENDKVNSRIGNLEKTVIEQRNLIESYRTVLKDMVYSNWLNWPLKEESSMRDTVVYCDKCNIALNIIGHVSK